MATSRFGGTSARIERIEGGCWVATRRQISGSAAPSNGARAVTSSYRMTPKPQMSVRVSTPRVDSICSADMKKGDPMLAVVLVWWNELAPEPVIFDIPKQ